MGKRHQDAIMIQDGACNPHGITRSLVHALGECRDEGMDTAATCADPAIRLIVHQLAFLCCVRALDDRLTIYSQAIDQCRREADMEPLASRFSTSEVTS